jgi:hypothetical protein
MEGALVLTVTERVSLDEPPLLLAVTTKLPVTTSVTAFPVIAHVKGSRVNPAGKEGAD